MLVLPASAAAARQYASLSDADSYDIYGTLFNQVAIAAPERQPLVILSFTRIRNGMACQPPSATAEWTMAMEDFLQRNASPYALNAQRLTVNAAVDVVRWEDIYEGNDSGMMWTSLAKRWPKAKGFYDVSAVGFNERHTQAVVYIGHHAGESGAAQFHFMEKAGGWRDVRVDTCREPPAN
jgi:hypothetical protein